MNRAYRILAGVALAAGAAAPLTAQFPDSLAFLKAVRDGDGDKVQSFVENPNWSAINMREPRTGEGALHILVQRRELNWLAFLLGRGARADLQRNDGTTPLALAAQLGWVEGAEQLLARGAKVDLANSRGETPLILAVQAGQLPAPQRLAMVSLLLRLGADPRRTENYSGYSALDYAKRDGRSPEIVRVLEARPARNPAMVGPNP